MVKVNGTCIVNPGMASKGQGALITLEDDIKVDFIDTK
jgi:Icc-related predicted phosphoesterase